MVDRKLNVLEKYMQKLSNAEEDGDRKAEGLALFNIGNYHYGISNFRKAIQNYTEASSIFKEIGLRVLERSAYANLGNAYYGMGNFRQAIQYHKQHLSIAKEVKDKAGEGRAYGHLGNAYNSIGNFKEAIEYHKQHLSIAKKVGDRAGEGVAYCNLGNAYYSMGDFKQAMEYHKKSLGIVKEVEDRAGEGRAYGNLGNAYSSMGNFKKAIEYHKQHLSITKEVGDRAGEGIAYGNIGIAFDGMGNFKKAIEYHKQHLSIAKEVGDRAGEGKSYGNISSTFHSMGNFKEATEYQKKGLGIMKEVEDSAGEGRAYGNLGNAYFSMCNFKEAIEYHKQHLSIAKEVGDRAGEGIAYGNLGNAYFCVGKTKQAIEYYKQNLSIVKEVGDRAGEGKAYANLGNVFCSMCNFKQAIEYHKQHLNIAKEIEDEAGEGKAYGHLGDAYYSLGNYKQAILYYKQDLSIAKDVEDRAGEERAYGSLGIAYFSKGELENGILCNEQHLSIAKETGNQVGQGRACYNLGLVHESSGSICTALNYYRLSIKHFDETRRLLQSEDALKISFRHTKRLAYTALWTALLKNGEVDQGLYAAEQGRAQALTDILKVQYGVNEEPCSEVATKESAPAVLGYLSSQTVFTALQGSTISFWLLRKGDMIHFRQKEIKAESAESLMKATFKEISSGAVARCENRSLDRQHKESSYTREAVQETSPSSNFSLNVLQPLYDVLVNPIEDLLQGEDLVFVPDGPFCLAPYSALSESVRIRTVPSLTTLKVIFGAPHYFHAKNEAMLVGDPCLKEVTYGTGAPMFEQLPCAKKEVEMIGELLRTAPLTGRNATKNEVLKRMKSAALIHIAAHGDPEFGEIAFAPNPKRTSQFPEKEDYLLTMSDVHAVRLQARLVVLSCCHSGQGEINSEGVVGIARAFLCAGARSVLVSLWAIDDEATLLFMKCFYQHLADRKSASLALCHAMKSLRETKKYSDLKYWAPFVLIGDDVTFEFGLQELEKDERVLAASPVFASHIIYKNAIRSGNTSDEEELLLDVAYMFSEDV
ncbi:tetratricopeptide repeat protein 28-like [Montipora capricornis]|uniref:tetratricopeptide repeat protein 28-like n=1 Tax=Montipora capricornis TaxID=246305 RepID=UPI0035F1EDA7